MEKTLHRLKWVLASLILCLLSTLAFWWLTYSPSAEAQTSQAPRLVLTSKPTPVATPAPVAPVTTNLPAGSATYTAKRGDSVVSVARHYVSQTSFLTSSELAEAIRKANDGFSGTFLKSGQALVIPGILDSPVVEKSVSVPRDFEVRAVYLTGVMAGSDRGLKISAAGANWAEMLSCST